MDVDDTEHGKRGFLHKDMFRPTKTRMMLANRACRNSITVGKALSKKQMREITWNLAGLECPWNCRTIFRLHEIYQAKIF